MELNNLSNANEKKLKEIEALENQGEHVSDLEKPQESLENKEVSVVDDAEEILKLELELKKIEAKSQATLDAINKIHQELGIDKVDSDIKDIDTNEFTGLKSVKAKILKFKDSINNLGKVAIVGGLMMGATSEALSQNTNLDKEKQKQENFDKWVNKQYDLFRSGKIPNGTIVTGPDGAQYKIAPLENNNLNKNKSKKESLDGDDEIKSINISSYFKTGTVEFVDAQSEENAKQSIRDFLNSVKDLENSTIQVIGSYSKDRHWGEVSLENPYGDKNTNLANDRKDLCLSLLQDILKEKYSENYINNLSIETISKGIGLSDKFTQDEIEKMSKEEKTKMIDSNQGMFLEIVKKITKDPIKYEKIEKNSLNAEEMEFLNTAIVIIDESNSMKGDAKRVKGIIEKVNKYNKENNKKAIEVFKLEGGNNEAHIQTLKNILSKLDETYAGKDILVLTDEPDENFDNQSYDEEINNIINIAKEKKMKIIFKLFNPNEAKKGSITVELEEDTKDVLKPIKTLNKIYFTKEDLRQAWFDNSKSLVKDNSTKDYTSQ